MQALVRHRLSRDEHEEHAQARRGHREEIEGDNVSHMVVEERPPGLRRLMARCRDHARDGALVSVSRSRLWNDSRESLLDAAAR